MTRSVNKEQRFQQKEHGEKQTDEAKMFVRNSRSLLCQTPASGPIGAHIHSFITQQICLSSKYNLWSLSSLDTADNGQNWLVSRQRR
jgi:hypothetical protein